MQRTRAGFRKMEAWHKLKSKLDKGWLSGEGKGRVPADKVRAYFECASEFIVDLDNHGLDCDECNVHDPVSEKWRHGIS